MKTKIKIGEKIYQVEISEIKEDLIKVRVDDKNYFFRRNEFQELVPLEKENYPSLSNLEEEGVCLVLEEKEIKSPLAGKISGIYVKEGEKVKPGQRVITLIAMKMENEVIAESYGQVKEIKVRENQSINTGEVLIIFE
jgi:biotin carboxyl carrier protein